MSKADPQGLAEHSAPGREAFSIIGRFAPKIVTLQSGNPAPRPKRRALNLRIEDKRIAKICQTAGAAPRGKKLQKTRGN
jgi:hypothetical protein